MRTLSKIDFVEWETEVGELSELESRTEGFLLMNLERLPEELIDIPVSQIIYLGGVVSAFATRDYINSFSPNARILDLRDTKDRGNFCPVPPNYFVENSPD